MIEILVNAIGGNHFVIYERIKSTYCTLKCTQCYVNFTSVKLEKNKDRHATSKLKTKGFQIL